MSAMCISAIGEGASEPLFNRYRNTNKTISDVSNVLATCTLANYGESQGKRCGSCCFEDLPVTAKINALVLHNCETGEIIDFQCPPLGLTCDDGQYCVDMTCWALNTVCANETEDDLLDPCDDPCKICLQLRKDILNCVREKAVSGWSNSGKSVRYYQLQASELRKELRHYTKLCRAKTGRRRQIKIPCVEYCPPSCD